MAYKLIFAAEVYDDLQQNIDWYNDRQVGLGSRFFKAVKAQIPGIKKNPFSFAVRYENIRCAKVKGFPFLIHFKIFPDSDIIRITAVLNTYRDPKLWDKRKDL